MTPISQSDVPKDWNLLNPNHDKYPSLLVDSGVAERENKIKTAVIKLYGHTN